MTSERAEVSDEVREDGFTVRDVKGDPRAVLDALRLRLLDLTLLNRVLNFRPAGPRVVRVIDELPDALFARLARDAELELAPAPLPPEDHALHAAVTGPRKERRAAAEAYAAEAGLATSHDLPRTRDQGREPAERHADARMQTLLFPADLEAELRTLASEARSAIEEKGSNVLYLVFGFLEWYEDATSEKAILSPLVMLPVALRRGEPDRKTGAYRFFVRASEEDVLANVSLQEKLRRDFGIALPDLAEDELPEAYFDRVAALPLPPRWKVRAQVALGLLSFTKLFMYRDLDPATWKEGQSPAEHPLVRDLFAGAGTGAEYATEYDFEGEGAPKHVPPILLDADSSQHSAIVDALEGRTLVIEGPPGTGKSQTIANLIAAALAEGKSVLFVAEKLTALEVVRRRLEDVALGGFCLELHSDKTQKSRLGDHLRRRLEARGTFAPPPELPERLRGLHATRQELNAYAGKLAAPRGAVARSLHDLVWRLLELSAALGADAARFAELVVPGAATMSRAELETLVAAAGTFGDACQALGGAPLATHPFAGVALEDAAPEAAARLLRALETLVTASAVARDAIERASTTFGDAALDTEAEAAALTAHVFRLKQAATGLPLAGLGALGKPEARAELAAWAGRVTAQRARASRIHGAVDGDVGLAMLASSEEALAAFAPGARLGTILRLSRMSLGMHALLERSGRMADLFAEWLGEPTFPRTLAAVGAVSELLGLLAGAGPEVLAHRTPPEARAAVQALVREGVELQQERARLAASFDLSLLPADGRVLEGLAATAATAGVLSFFSAEYREAKRVYALVHRGPFDGAQMANGLRALASFQRRAAAFAQRPEHARLLGPAFRGIDTHFEAVAAALGLQEQLAAWAERHHALSARLAEVPRAPLARLEALGALRRTVDLDVAGLREQIAEVVGLEREGRAPFARPIGELHAAIDALVQLATPIGHLVEHVRVAESSPIAELVALRADAEALRQEADAIEDAELPRRVLGAAFLGAATDVELVSRTLAFAAEVHGAATPAGLRAALVAAPRADRLEELHRQLVTTNEALSASDAAEAAFLLAAGTTAASWYGAETSRTPATVHARATRALDAKETLGPWLALGRARTALVAAGGEPLAAALAAAPPVSGATAKQVAELAFVRALARAAFEADADLRRHDGAAHEALRERFRAGDREVMRLFRAELAARIDARPIPEGVKSTVARERTELALLQHELGKQRGHLPIRQLLRRAGGALRALSPCFMMSPRSVAQYLEPGAAPFDLVIMDEASQLRPEDAIGAIARARQAVIVGDSKQLPPTSFFVGGGEDDEPDEELVVETKESILDLAKLAFRPVRRLRWHYRSRHESLIAFSNARYYDGSLVVFPSPIAANDELGVSLVPVPDGLCIGGVNDVEARRVVDAVLVQLRTRPGESFGVVAMNVKQKERIAELLDEALKPEVELRKAYEASDAFVKNLEAVQGDERDVILLSVTYGRSAPGARVARTFGPLNGASGRRRLNVLFTRARRRVVAFSSMSPEDLGDAETLSPGAADLRAYLLYARSRGAPVTEGAAEREETPLARTLGAALGARGRVAVPGVGTPGCTVELALRHADRPDLVLAIEGDGAGYARSFSARDRERLREQVLTGLGWTTARVWATEAYRDLDGECAKLVARADAAAG